MMNNPNKIYALVVHDSEFKRFIFRELHVKMNWKPKKKRFWEKQVCFEERLAKWEDEFAPLVTKCLDFYKDLYPDFYYDYRFVSFGFSTGHEKTFWIYIQKNEVTDVSTD